MTVEDYIKENFRYDPDTGFIHRVYSKGEKYKEQPFAGSLWNNGYVRIGVQFNKKRVRFQAHRLAWLLYYGEWPKYQVDHINRNRSDNRIVNLREANPIENRWNCSAAKNNKLGEKGIHKAGNKYRVKITHLGKRIEIGRFYDLQEAKEAYADKAKQLRKDFCGENNEH